jgi:hypothetical protein
MLNTDAEAILELPGIDTIERYPFVLAQAGGAAAAHGMFERAEQLCQEALDAAGEPNDELAGLVFMFRAQARVGPGDVTGAVRYLERSVSAHRRLGDPFMLMVSLCLLAGFRPSDSAGVAVDEAREALALARQTGNPGSISVALGILARILVESEPEQSRTLIAESIELNEALGGVVVEETALVVAFMVSALLGERDQTLRLTARGLDRGISMLFTYCACLEATAQTLAPEQPEVTATLHGTIDQLVPSLAHNGPSRALRQRATEAINTQLDAARISELRAQGAAMTEDQATVYALDAIARAQ